MWRISEPVRLRLSVSASTSTATPPGPYPSYMTASYALASAPSPVPLAIARSMLSLGIEASRAFWIASASDGLPSGSPPPSFAATVIARASLVKSLPRRAATIAFLCLIPAHLECPDMTAASLCADRDGAGGDVRHPERAHDEALAPDRRPHGAERGAQRREGLARPDRDEVRPRAAHDPEARALEHAVKGGDVGLPPPRLVDPVQPRDRRARAQEARDELDGLRDDQRPAGPRVDALERPHRVAQVQQQRAEEDEVEAPVALGVEVVDAEVEALDLRAERLLGQLEARPPPPEGREVLGAAVRRGGEAHARRPVPARGVVDVDGGHARRPAALELEGPEAVPRADLEHPHAAEVGGQRHVPDRAARVEVPRGDDPSGQLDRVVPGELAHPLGQARHGGAA